MKRCLMICSLLVSLTSHAQLKYAGKAEAGLMNGNYETTGYVTTAHGIKYKQWFTGIGAGMDFYRYRSIPAFIELHHYLGKSTVQPFIIASAGINIAYPTASEKQETVDWWQTSQSFKNGFYCRIGGGVVLNGTKRVKYAVNAAWNYKTLKRIYNERNFGPWPQPTETIEKTMLYRLNRISIGISAMF